MTDCYVCGHPVLEGQREAVHREVVDVTRESTKVEDFTVHANPADHLPTLSEKLVSRSDLAPSLKREREFAVREERERAARLVEEKGWDILEISEGDAGCTVTFESVQKLAQRIREGE